MIVSWSPSSYDKYVSCPRRAKYDLVDKLCPACFKGRLEGWDPQVCAGCGKSPEVPKPLARGTKIHEAAELYIGGQSKLNAELRNVQMELKRLKLAFEAGSVLLEHKFVFNAAWQPVSKFTKGAWLRATADVIEKRRPPRGGPGQEFHLTDWKTGGVDKRTGEIKKSGKYVDQLEIYAMCVLSSFPECSVVHSRLVFVDAPAGSNVVALDSIRPRNLGPLKKKWARKLVAMMSDEEFAPSPSPLCGWCPFSRGAGGPCSF